MGGTEIRITEPVKHMDRILRKNRISVDIDNQSRLKLLIAYYNMKHLTPNVHVYKTGGGYHIHGEFPERTTKQNMDIRRLLGDCTGRIELDEIRQNTFGDETVIEMLFYEKITKGKKTYEEPLYDITSPPYWGDSKLWKKNIK